MWKIFLAFVLYPAISEAFSISNTIGRDEEFGYVILRFENDLNSSCWSNKDYLEKHIVDKFQNLGIEVVYTDEEFSHVLFMKTLGHRLEERCFATIVITLLKFHSLIGEPPEFVELLKQTISSSIENTNINQFSVETVNQFFTDF